MARIKGGLNARRKHNKVLKLAKGYKLLENVRYESAHRVLFWQKAKKETI